MGVSPSNLSNNFNYSLLKKRIFMMTRKKSGRISSLKALVAIPIIAIALITISSTQSNGNKSVTLTEPNSSLQTTNAMIEPDKQPEFKGGQNAMIEYLIKEIKYPVKAKEDGIQGKVYVQFTVSKTGKVTDVKVERGVSTELDNEAKRVIESMPDWIPAEANGKKVEATMTLPIQFKLDDEKK
jgi:TonB family protein